MNETQRDYILLSVGAVCGYVLAVFVPNIIGSTVDAIMSLFV